MAAYMSARDNEDHQQKLRFQVELEFVQCLANPNYLNFLAQNKYFQLPEFINYLSYLQYWKQPKYAKFLKYPQCLYFLELLQYDSFRQEVINQQCAKFIDDQQLLHWQHYTRKRTKLYDLHQAATAASSAQQAAAAAAAPLAPVGKLPGQTNQQQPQHFNK